MHLHHSLSFGSDFASDLSLRELALSKMIADREIEKQKQKKHRATEEQETKE